MSQVRFYIFMAETFYGRDFLWQAHLVGLINFL